MLTTYRYHSEHTVTFEKIDGELLVNATEMAKPFGKQPKDFLKNKSTQEYITVLADRRKILSQNIVRVIHGDNGGTWLHQKLALRFAQWLSPDFAVWVDEKIEELLTAGKVELSQMNQFDLMRRMVDTLEETNRISKHNRKNIEIVKSEVSTMQSSIREVEAKASIIDTDHYAIPGYYILRGRQYDLSPTEVQQLGKRLAKYSRANNYAIQQIPHAKWGRVGGYHVEVYKAVLGF